MWCTAEWRSIVDSVQDDRRPVSAWNAVISRQVCCIHDMSQHQPRRSASVSTVLSVSQGHHQVQHAALDSMEWCVGLDVPHPRKREFFLFKWHVLVHFERACLDATAYSSCVFTLHALPTQLPPDDHLNSAIVSASVSGTLSGKSWMDMSPLWRRPCNQS